MDITSRTTNITLSFNVKEEPASIQVTRYLTVDDPEDPNAPFDKHTSVNIPENELTVEDIAAVKKFLLYANKL